MGSSSSPSLSLRRELFSPGLRLAVGLSGGADSTALLRLLAARRQELGLTLHAAHLHHGLRAAEADADLDFCRHLAASLQIPFHEAHVDVAAEAAARRESLEEAARRLRYAWFRSLLAAVPLDAIATAHTLDDQAETVLAKFLRGAWTEGLSGAHPVVAFPEGRILRPLLSVSRKEIEAYLHALGQDWREDSSNRDPVFTRNRIRHELLPQLEGWNPQIRKHLCAMAELAKEEESYLQAEVARLASQLILAGLPVRGGGRSGAEQALAIDLPKLAELPVALARRLLRLAVARLGLSLSFEHTEELRALALSGRAGQKRELPSGLRAERSHRELRLSLAAATAGLPPVIEFSIPGQLKAPAYGLRLSVASDRAASVQLRPWRSGDRVRLRYSSGPRKLKEVLDRLKVAGDERLGWPVLELDGRIVWMRGAELEPEPGLLVEAQTLELCAPSEPSQK